MKPDYEPRARERLPIVGIGASAGGLEALREMLSSARSPCGMAFVVVQHLDPNHESMLAQLLARHTSLEVRQCEGGERILPDTIYIIPPGHGLAVRGGVLELTEFAQPRGLRRPIDDFFASLASDQEADAACVILSGTGADGTTGLRAIKEHGGVCIVQQPETARYDGMPLSAVGTGLVDFIKQPSEIVDCLSAFFGRRGQIDTEQEAELVADHVDELCKTLRTTVGHDFAGYKRTTFTRRVERRMHVLGIASGRAYLTRVKGDPEECEALFRDLLINVTRFFRDPELFDALRTKVIEPMVRERPAGEELRVWIPGCSSGEEAYSMAMLFADAARKIGDRHAVQIFATDIDERMLRIAREGSYPVAALADIPAPFREQYTVPHTDRFTIAAPIRDMIRFSSHSLVKDPPFSRVDLVSCRNLLIYFDDRLQQSVLPLFHYSVRPGGYLFLGPSESVGRFEHMFPAIDHGARIFQRSAGPPTYPVDLPGRPERRFSNEDAHSARSPAAPLRDESAPVRRLLDRYAPASVVLDLDGMIVGSYGKLGKYFDFPVTRAGGTSAIGLARPGLRTVIGPLLRSARDTRRRVVSRGVEVVSDHGTQVIDVVCDPLPDSTLLFVFQETGPFAAQLEPDATEFDPADDNLDALEDELRITRHRLRATVEELETANEELKSSNEEMMSMNEELQSTNEELTTVNDELKSKVDQLTVANADLRNFFDSTDLAVVVLDARLRVRNFTEAATSVFPLQPTDRGRPLQDVASRLADDSYIEDARRVAAGHAAIHRRVFSRDGERTYSLQAFPYRTQAGQVEGATLVLTDITEALILERDRQAQSDRLDMAIRAGGIGVWEYVVDSGETLLDATQQALMGVSGAEAGRIESVLDQIVPEDRPAVEAALRRAATGEADFEASFRVQSPEYEVRRIKGFGRLVTDTVPKRLVGVSLDVTAEYRLAETRELMIREMNHRVKNLFAVIGGMLSAAARSHTDVRRFAMDMRDRIAALGQAHSLAALAREDDAVELAVLLETTIAPYRDHARIEIGGPAFKVRSTALSPLSLMLHEWATNSVKYGALGSKGDLAIHWTRNGDTAVLRWDERGDKPVELKDGTGFGTLLVETSSRQLGAKVTRSAQGAQLSMTVELPASVSADDE